MNEPFRLVSALAADADATLERARRFEDLVEAEHADLYSALCLITRDRVEAEDLMQDAFLKVWERWDRVSSMDDPTGYLYKTSMNLFRKRTRRAKLAVLRRVRLAPSRDELAEVEARDAVVRALGALTSRQRMSLVLTDLLDYSSQDAATLMGVTSSTVRVLASQARATLKKNAGGSDE
jgi:RNA polymerase sigma-70 factor (ECF subfamily)